MNTKDILFYFMILVVVALSIYVLVFIKSESYQCMNTPLQYGLSKYTADIVCTCSAPGVSGSFIATKDNLTALQVMNTGLSHSYDLNFSNYNLTSP